MSAKHTNGNCELASMQYPLTPNTVLSLCRSILTAKDIENIKKYRKVFYLGENSLSKLRSITERPECQERVRYFDKKGYFKTEKGAHICFRFEILGDIATGGFSKVIRALDHKYKRMVAIKIFKSWEATDRYIYRESMILRTANAIDGGNGVVQLLEKFSFRKMDCLVFELLSCSLKELLLFRPEGLPISDISVILRQLCTTLEVLHKNSIMHMDIKPHNIAFRGHGHRVVLIDFGLSVFTYSSDRFGVRQTIGYQSPEVVLGGMISPAVDMWSIGCLAAEMFTGEILFQCGNIYDEMASMIELLGVPPKTLLSRCTRGSVNVFFNDYMKPRYCYGSFNNPPASYSKYGKTNTGSFGIGMPGSKRLSAKIPGYKNSGLLSFVSRCFAWEPRKRITAAEALRHQFLRTRPATDTACSSICSGQTTTEEIATFKAYTLLRPQPAFVSPEEAGDNLESLYYTANPFPIRK